MDNLPCAHTPPIVRGRDDDTRTPRVRGSDGRRICLALPARIPERRATSTGRSLRHKALINSGPYAGTAARTPRQRMIGLGPDHTPAMMSLLHTRRQQPVVRTPLGAGVATVRSVFRRKTPGPLQAPTWEDVHPVPLPLPGGGDHHELTHQLRPRSLLVALGRETDGLARRRLIATVACRCGRKVKNWRSVDGLYCRLAHVQCTTGDGRHRKWTTKGALRDRRNPHRRAIPTEDCTTGAHKTSHGRTTVRCAPDGKERKSQTYGEK